MNSRGRDWSVVNGDPAPGNPDGIRRTGNTFVEIAEVAKSAGHDLRAIKERQLVNCWEGEAADRFRKSLEEDFLTHLGKLERSYFVAGHALQDYATELADLQMEADPTCDRAHQADRDEHGAAGTTSARQQDLRNRQADVGRRGAAVANLDREYYATLARRAHDDPTYDQRYRDWRRRYEQARSDLRNAQNAVQDVQSEVTRAQAELGDARRRLKAARDQCADIRRRNQDAQRRAADQLEEASRLGIRNKSLLQKWWDLNVKAFKSVKDYVTNLDNWDTILEVAGIVFTVLAICFPPAAPVFLALAVGASILKAGLTIYLYCQDRDNKTLTDVFLDCGLAIADVVTLGAASKVAGAFKLATKIPKAGRLLGAAVEAKPFVTVVGTVAKERSLFPLLKRWGMAEEVFGGGYRFASGTATFGELLVKHGPKAAYRTADLVTEEVTGKPITSYLWHRYGDDAIRIAQNGLRSQAEFTTRLAERTVEGIDRLGPAAPLVPPIYYPLIPSLLPEPSR